MNYFMESRKPWILIIFILTSIIQVKATTYYIDNTNGNDNFTGVSPTTAWKTFLNVNATTFLPGDTILLQANGTWSEQLYPKGSGSEGDPIVIDKYGEGAKPLIAGAGLINYVVQLHNQQHWEINNLEITNLAANEGDRLGVCINADNGSTHHHIYLRNLEIHDISGRYTFEIPGKNTGGIGFRLLGSDNNTRFDDLLVEGCEIYNITRVGISSHSSHPNANNRKGDQPITNMIVRNNTIHHTAGDGLILRSTEKAIVENNLAYDNHNANEGLVSYGVALWCRSTDSTLFQFNEVYNTRGALDGQSFDADFEAHGTIFQYNYSHDNEGGFLLIMNGVTGTVVRYNIIENDGAIGKHVFNFSDYDPGGNPNRGIAHIYNNTVYIPKGSQAAVVEHATATSSFTNNIIYNYGSGVIDIASIGQKPVWSHNAVYGSTSLPADANLLTADPMLVAAGAGGTGLASVEGYKLQSGSPALNSGKLIANNGGRDYFSNPVSAIDLPNRGAYNGTGIPVPVIAITSPTTDSHFENPQQINSTATVTDPMNAVITEVEFFVNGNSIGTDNTYPYSVVWDIPSNGTYSITAEATNANGLKGTSSAVTITVGPATVCHLTIDDAEEKETTGAVQVIQTDDLRLFFDPWGSIGGQLAYQQLVGIRFTNLGLPKGAVIENAYLQFTADEPDPGSGGGVMNIYIEDTDNSLPFTTTTYNISGRNVSSASVEWQPVPWTATGAQGEAQRSPDLKELLQDIVNRNDWQENNAVGIIIKGSGDLKRYARSLEGSDPSNAARLCISFTPPTVSSITSKLALNTMIYPNPSQGVLTVSIAQGFTEATEIQVIDLFGQTHYEKVIEPQRATVTELMLSGIPQGIYLVKITQGKKSHCERLVVTE